MGKVEITIQKQIANEFNEFFKNFAPQIGQ